MAQIVLHMKNLLNHQFTKTHLIQRLNPINANSDSYINSINYVAKTWGNIKIR